MGSLVGNLANPGVQQPGGQTQFFNPGQVQSGAYAKALTPQPGTLQPQGTNNPQGSAPSMPQSVQPSFLQAAQMGVPQGEANAMSPGLSKAGKLAVLLTGGLKGALAGQAASAQAVLQSGGRRGGSAGAGFEAGYTEPIQEQAQRNQLQQQQAQIALTKAQSDMVPTPYGNMPAALARYILPASIREQGTLGSAQIGAGSRQQVAQTNAASAQNVAQINKRFMAVPNVGLYDTTTKQVIPGTAQGITITPDIAKDYGLPDQFVGKPMSLSGFSSLENAQRFNEQPVEGSAGPSLVNRNPASPDFGKVTPLGLGNPSLGHAVQVGDVNNPGQTKYETAGEAIQQQAPGTQSASVQVPKVAAKAEVPTKIGDQKVNFTTMIQHAKLLRTAAKALNNGDVQTLSGLENAFKNEFGYSGPVTAAAIADAYQGEVTNVINKGHITDKGSEKVAHTIDLSKQNFATVDSVLGAYQALGQSKLDMVNKQEQNAINQSQPKKPGAANAAPPAPSKFGDWIKNKNAPGQ